MHALIFLIYRTSLIICLFYKVKVICDKTDKLILEILIFVRTTKGPSLFLIKQLQIITLSWPDLNVGIRHFGSYLSLIVLQTYLLLSPPNTSYLDSSLQIIFFHSSTQSFLLLAQDNLLILLAAFTKGFLAPIRP